MGSGDACYFYLCFFGKEGESLKDIFKYLRCGEPDSFRLSRKFSFLRIKIGERAYVKVVPFLKEPALLSASEQTSYRPWEV